MSCEIAKINDEMDVGVSLFPVECWLCDKKIHRSYSSNPKLQSEESECEQFGSMSINYSK